jgi:hypothetical protein
MEEVMQNTTESPMLLAAGFPPPLSATPPTPPNMISQAPTLPRVAAKASPAPSNFPTSNPFATSMGSTPPPATPPRHSTGRVRRFFSWLIVLAVIGGLAAAAFIYGPELMDRATGEEAVDEPEAPMSFPTPVIPLAPIRSATYTVEKQSTLGAVETYTVTTDYETGFSQTIVDRSDAPDLEIVSGLDAASIRRVDEPIWYGLPQGDFPVDSSLGRTRWVRTLDELLPPEVRTFATVTQATESVVGGEPARHLVLTIDPTHLVPPPVASTIAADPAIDPATIPDAATIMPPGFAVTPGADPSAPISFHLWVDNAGLVRKLALPDSLGSETITVTSVSSDAFVPQFPAIEVIHPMTARALYGLGL